MTISVKKTNRTFSMLLAVVMLLFTTLLPTASAATGSTTTPYGTLSAKLIVGWYDAGHGNNDLRFDAETSISSSTKASVIGLSIEACYNDTGAKIYGGSWSDNNINSFKASNWFWVDSPKRGVAVYSAHQVIFTNSYVVYLVATA